MKELIYKLYRWLYYRNLQNDWLEHFIESDFGNKPIQFLQIGANDGITADPIHKYVTQNKWRGVLIEPHPYFFQQLKKTYTGVEGLTFIDAAIVARPTATISLFVASEDLSDWRSLVSSTDASRGDIKWLKKSGSVKEIEVKAMTFAELQKTTDIKKIDLLQIDVEGLENELITAFLSENIRPKLIHFEHKHLTYAEMADVETKLEAAGYKIYIEKYDTLCRLRK